MPVLDGPAEPDPETQRALRALLEANDAFRVAYHSWLKAQRRDRGPEARALREARARVDAARELVERTHKFTDEKDWGGH